MTCPCPCDGDPTSAMWPFPGGIPGISPCGPYRQNGGCSHHYLISLIPSPLYPPLPGSLLPSYLGSANRPRHHPRRLLPLLVYRVSTSVQVAPQSYVPLKGTPNAPGPWSHYILQQRKAYILLSSSTIIQIGISNR